MLDDIYKLIEKFEVIVLARHVGPDPDAMASTMALKDSILYTFKDKKVYNVGSGSSRFTYFGKLDRIENPKNALLIVLDTPDIRRIDGITLTDYEKIVKIDHHPFVEKFADIEYINDKSSSASELVLDLINETPLKMNEDIASKIYLGIVSDTNRFMFNNSTGDTFKKVAKLIDEYKLEIDKLYIPLYLRPINEVRLEGYIGLNLNITKNGVGYIKLTKDLLEQFAVDAASPGNMVNNFNYINEVLVWVFFTEDVKNENIRVSARSRGPVINSLLSKYNGGGHKYASGARIKTMDDTDPIIDDLDFLCKKYKEEVGENFEN
ncbi:MAG: bifunctional oligoribonuclease/PAP phosphatase NrnA [Erysipelotrichaceae bacterium]|nr:bifunctional oligoribonuclease/PAP phosphatase NrnA [Erysipelotrichaceae bacterium]